MPHTLRTALMIVVCFLLNARVACTGGECARRDKNRMMLNGDAHLLLAPEPEESVECVDCRSYVELPAKGKLDLLWKKIESDEYGEGELPMDFVPLLSRLHAFRSQSRNHTMSRFFDRFSDENPVGHSKTIHTFGSVAKVRFEPADNNEMGLTGMFKDGMDFGVLRFSIVADWTKWCKGGTDLNFKGCFKPSLALKMLRDNDFSSNTVAQVNLGDGVGQDFNFFNHIMGTHLPTPKGLAAGLIKQFFSAASEKSEIGGVGLQELASAGSKAKQTKDAIKAPLMLYFVPTDTAKAMFETEEHDVRNDFKDIESGEHLYQVYAAVNGDDGDDSECYDQKEPNDHKEPKSHEDLLKSKCKYGHVGNILTDSRFVSSAYGDHRLFFQHERLKTKGGVWQRKACVSDDALPDNAEYRMADDMFMTCTQLCPDGTEELPENDIRATCPFAALED